MKNLKLFLFFFLGTAIFLNFAYFLDICDFNPPQALMAQLAPSDSGSSSTFDYWYVYFFILLVLLVAYFVISDYEPRGLPGFLIGLLLLAFLPFIYLLNRFFGLKIFFRPPSEEPAQPAEIPFTPSEPAAEAGPAAGVQPPPEILQPFETPPPAILPSFETPAFAPSEPAAEAGAVPAPAGPAAPVPAGKFKKFFSTNKKPILIAAASLVVLILAAGGVFIFTGKPFISPTAAPSPLPIAVSSPTPAPVLTPTPALIPTPTPTPLRTPTPTPIPTFSPTPVSTPVSTPTPVFPPVLTPSPTQTVSPSPSPGIAPTPTFVALASPTPAVTPSPSPPSVGGLTSSPAAAPASPTPGLPSFLRPGEQPYVAPQKTAVEVFLEKMIPHQYRSLIFIVIVFVLIPLLYFSPVIFLIKNGISHILFLIEKMRTTAGVSPPAPVYTKLTLTPARIISFVFVVLLIAVLIFIKPFSIFVSAPSPTVALPPILTPTPTSTPITTPTPAFSPSPSPTVTQVVIISPTPVAAPTPSPAPTPIPSPTAALTPTPTLVAIFSPTPLPTAVETPTPTPFVTITPFASPTPSPMAIATESPLVSPTAGPSVETPPPSIFAPVKEFYRRAVSTEYRWLIYLLAAVWFAILALLPVLSRLAATRGKIGNLFKKIVAGKIGIMDFRFSVIAGNWAAAEWRTKTLSDSVVEFSVYPSSNPKYQQELAMDSELTKEHKLIIRGLKPDTTYYFKVSSTDKFGNREQTPEMSFKTAETEKEEKAKIIV